MTSADPETRRDTAHRSWQLAAMCVVSTVGFAVVYNLPDGFRGTLPGELAVISLFAAWLTAFVRWGGTIARSAEAHSGRDLRFGTWWPWLILLPAMGGILCGFALREIVEKLTSTLTARRDARRRWAIAFNIAAGFVGWSLAFWTTEYLHRLLGFRFWGRFQPGLLSWTAMQICLLGCLWELRAAATLSGAASNDEAAPIQLPPR